MSKKSFKFEDAENSYDNSFLHFWYENWFFCFSFFAFRQILGCWFQISQSFFLIVSLKTPKRTFLVSNLRIFIFAQNFFKLSTQNYTNKAFLVPKLKLFVMHDLPFHKSEGTDFNYNNFFKDFSLKILRKNYFLSQI